MAQDNTQTAYQTQIDVICESGFCGHILCYHEKVEGGSIEAKIFASTKNKVHNKIIVVQHIVYGFFPIMQQFCVT